MSATLQRRNQGLRFSRALGAVALLFATCELAVTFSSCASFGANTAGSSSGTTTAAGTVKGTTAPQKAIIVHQKSDCYGPVTTYYTDKAVKMVMDNTKIFLVATAPEWRVVFYDPDKNQALELPLDQWLKHTPSPTYLPEDAKRSKWKATPDGKGVCVGHNCEKYAVGTNGQYLALENTLAAPEACHIMQKFLYVPQVKGIPMNYAFHLEPKNKPSYLKSFGGSQSVLVMVKYESGSEPDTFFSYPKKFKNVRREIDVLATHRAETVEGAIDGFVLGK